MGKQVASAICANLGRYYYCQVWNEWYSPKHEDAKGIKVISMI